MGGDEKNRDIIRVGPEGNPTGLPWDEKYLSKIVQIFISHSDIINSLQFQHVDGHGTLMLSERQGTNIGSKFDVVRLDFPTEYVTWMSSHLQSHDRNVCSLTFGTNKGEYGPFGKINGFANHFRFKLGDDRQLAGFFGTADSNGVKSIGVYLKPKRVRVRMRINWFFAPAHH